MGIIRCAVEKLSHVDDYVFVGTPCSEDDDDDGDIYTVWALGEGRFAVYAEVRAEESHHEGVASVLQRVSQNGHGIDLVVLSLVGARDLTLYSEVA